MKVAGPLAAALLALIVSGCAAKTAVGPSVSAPSVGASRGAPSSSAPVSAAVLPDPAFLASEPAAEAAEYIRLGRESMLDSTWFEASEYLDSALAQLADLEASESLPPSGHAAVKLYQDSVRNWLVYAVGESARLGEAEDMSDYINHEIEAVSLSSLEDLEKLLPRLADRNYDLELPSPMPEAVLKAMRVFTGPGRGYFEKWLQRRGRYEELISAKLKERGMPQDLMYLAMVESGFNPRAWSRTQASGIWQFMSGTGRRYGLKDDWWEDSRRDPVRATDAALDYLEDLHAEFGDWHVAMAAYNCGEGRIRRQLDRSPDASYWDMSLPEETRFYVPKILAAMIIGHNPAAFGFSATAENAAPPLHFDTATVGRCLPLRGIARATGINEDTLKILNPSLRRWCTPPGKKSYTLYLPEGTRDAFYANYESIDTVARFAVHRHVVARGQTLARIASRYGVSAASIRRENGLRGARLRTGQVLIIPVVGVSEPGEEDYESAPVSVRTASVRHKVRKGETLSALATRYGVTPEAIRSASRLGGKSLRVGQVLTVPVAGAEPGLKTVARVTSSSPASSHRIRKGETLYSIARQFRVSVTALRRANGLTPRSVLKTGRVLSIPGTGREVSAAGFPGTVLLAANNDADSYYKVRSGDNLWDISSRFGQSVGDLKRLNDNLSEETLRPGQTIRVR